MKHAFYFVGLKFGIVNCMISKWIAQFGKWMVNPATIWSIRFPGLQLFRPFVSVFNFFEIFMLRLERLTLQRHNVQQRFHTSSSWSWVTLTENAYTVQGYIHMFFSVVKLLVYVTPVCQYFLLDAIKDENACSLPYTHPYSHNLHTCSGWGVVEYWLTANTWSSFTGQTTYMKMFKALNLVFSFVSFCC